MFFKCPGQDGRNLSVTNIRCPGCGYELEIFSDEMKAMCPRCRARLCCRPTASCLDWCKFAQACVGEKS